MRGQGTKHQINTNIVKIFYRFFYSQIVPPFKKISGSASDSLGTGAWLESQKFEASIICRFPFLVPKLGNLGLSSDDW